jgi:hypothetical protein
MLGAGGHVQKGLGAVIHLAVGRIKEKGAYFIAEGRAPRLAGAADGEASLFEVIGQQAHLGRLAGPVGAFKTDE